MKILYITASSSYGGGPAHVFDLINQFVNKLEIIVACPKEEPYWSRYQRASLEKMIEIPCRKFTFSSMLHLRKEIKRHNVDIVHSHGKGAGLFGRAATAFTGVCLVHTPHGIHTDAYKGFKQKAYILYEQLSGRMINRIIHVSASECEKAQSLSLWRSTPYKIIPNGVGIIGQKTLENWRAEYRKKLIARAAEEGEVPIVVSISRFDYAKNASETIEIARRLPNMIFWLLGDGRDRPGLEAKCRNEGIINIEFFGFVSNTKPFIAAADIYLSTSRWEGLPLAVLEALSTSTPVVASDVVGNKDIIKSQHTGILYQLGDPDAGANAITRLAEDEQLRHSLAKEGSKLQSASFSLDKMADATYQLYQTLLAQS